MMAFSELFTYQWPNGYGRAAVALDAADGQAYDLLYSFIAVGGAQREKLERKRPITYDEVRKLARLACRHEKAEHALYGVDPRLYDRLDSSSWPGFVRHPPSDHIWHEEIPAPDK